MQYVSDEIGEAYKGTNYGECGGWVNGWLDIPEFLLDGYGGGNCIFISAPTGSGKTHFILNIWLGYIASQNKKMLYLVNRSILKAQLEKEIMDISPHISSCIDIKSYQDIEYELKMCEHKEYKPDKIKTDENGQCGQTTKYVELENMRQRYSKYDCVVCDECHYFLTDSNYNTDTSLSFRWIQDKFADKVRIFMSATIRDIELYIKGYDLRRMHEEKIQKYNFPDFEAAEAGDINKDAYEAIRNKGARYCKYCDFMVPRNYDYIDAKIIYNTDTIAEIINDGDKTEKWLIFVDKIDTGKELSKKIKDKNNVVFISSRNKWEEDVSDTVDEITYYKKMKSKKILIATSVMDNGINIKDIELRNIVLMADTETEFIQMLGRKREDGKKLRLYIYHYDKEHFERRLNQTEQILETAISYLKFLSSCKRNEKIPYDEEWVINNRHIRLMREIFDNKISMRYVKSLFNAYGGTLYLNLLAYQNLQNLKAFYQNVISAFDAEEDDTKRGDCFVRMQLGWLGIEEERAENIIKETKVTKFDKCYKKVIDAFESAIECSNPMNIDAAKMFQNKIRSELVVLVETTKGCKRYGTVMAQAGKSKCLISKKTMNYLNQNCGIPYKMEITGKKEDRKYTIIRDGCKTETPKQD